MKVRNHKPDSKKFKTMTKAALFGCMSFVSLAVWAQPSIILDTTPEDTEIPLAPGTDVQIDPISGNLFATPADPNACSSTVDCSDVQVDITSFTASPSTVNQGQNINFNWDARGGWVCEGSGLPGTTWNASGKLPSSSQAVSTTGLPLGDYDAVLTCSNGPVEDQLTRSITVQTDGSGPGIPQFCFDEGRVPPAGLSRDTAIGNSGPPFFNDLPGTTVLWEQFFGGQFPNTAGTAWRIGRNQYASLEFSTAGVAAGRRGQIEMNIPQGSNRFGPKVVTISQCPGDFLLQADSSCRRFIVNGAIRWSTTTSAPGRCTLLPNTTYYLNVLHTDEPDPDAPNGLRWHCDGTTQPCTDLVNSTISN